VTVGHRRFYAYRYEGKVSDCEKAVVLLCYSEKYFGSPDALRVFISTQTNLSTQEILEMYAKRWSIEVFFRNCKQKLAFDKCQLRKQRGIERMWLLLSLVHFLCCTLPDYRGVFEKGFAYFRECLLQA
jgi:transposase